jgi:hypothetical protein
VVSDGPNFLGLARQNKWQAQALIIEWVLRKRDKQKATGVRTELAAVKSLLDYAEITLGWKKILKVGNKVTKIGDKKPAPYPKAQEMYERADIRLK